MATTTLTPHQRAVRSTVAMKALMAVTGLVLIGFLLMHMYGNL
ncbi:MAG: succinate dehydrogenase, partial [Propionicimonas sp.]